jgi:hypothetical protein
LPYSGVISEADVFKMSSTGSLEKNIACFYSCSWWTIFLRTYFQELSRAAQRATVGHTQPAVHMLCRPDLPTQEPPKAAWSPAAMTSYWHLISRQNCQFIVSHFTDFTATRWMNILPCQCRMQIDKHRPLAPTKTKSQNLFLHNENVDVTAIRLRIMKLSTPLPSFRHSDVQDPVPGILSEIRAFLFQ